MMPAGPTYCIDTSSIIHAWRRAYPPKRFPGLWAALEGLIGEGRLVASIEVFNELARKDDDACVWAKLHKHALFREIDDDVQLAVIHIMASYPKLVDTGTGKSGGDPFVLALALANHPNFIVVTQEQGGSSKSPKIPSVCVAEGLECISLLDLIEREQWTF